MSDARLPAPPQPDDAAPIELGPEPIRLTGPPAEEVSPARSGRRPWRRIALVLALAVGVTGAAVIGTAGLRVFSQKDTELSTPIQVAGLQRDDSELALNTADYLRSGFAAGIDLDTSVGAIYRDPADAQRSVLLFGGTTLLWQPERDLDTLFGLMTDETGAVTGLREVSAGKLGGVMKCGSSPGEGGDFAVCGWADHGSVVMAMFPGRPVDAAADLFRHVREVVQTRH